MKGLLTKDFLLIRNQWTSALIIVAAGIFMSFSMQPSACIAYLMMIGMMLAIGTTGYDEFDNGYRFLFTLPVSRKTYALEKYVFAAIIILGFMVIGVAGAAIVTVVKYSAAALDILELLAEALAMFLIVMVAMSFSLPSRLKYGSEKGRIALYIIFGILTGIGLLLGYVLPAETVNAMELFVKSHATAVIISLTILAVAVIAGSVIISIRIMEKKEY